MKIIHTITTIALTSCLFTAACAQQTVFLLGRHRFIADNQFYRFGNVIRCAKHLESEETPAAICCHYPNHNTPPHYYYTGANYTCPRINGSIGTLSYRCYLQKKQLQSAKYYAHGLLTIQKMIQFCKNKP